MKDFLASFVNTSGTAFPNTAAVNSSGGGATDGTEFVKIMVDDMWGFQQALLNYTDDTPNGNSEVGASQQLTSIQKIQAYITTKTDNSTATIEDWNKHAYVILDTGCTTGRIAGGTGANRSNKCIVYNKVAGTCNIDFGASASQEVIEMQKDQWIEFVYDNTLGKFVFQKSNKEIFITITDDYTIGDWVPSKSTILINHSATTKLINVNLPTLADNLGKIYYIQNIGNGLTYINREGSDTIKFLGNSLTVVKLLMEDDFVEILGQAATWKTKHANINKLTKWIYRTDFTTAHVGSAFTYDTKSAAVDLTGQHITETTSNQTAIILFDSGGTGTSGIMYVYNIENSATGKGNWSNNRQVNCGSGGYNFLVNETSTSSQDIDYNIYIGYNALDINSYLEKKIFLNLSSLNFTSAIQISLNECEYDQSGNLHGQTFHIIDANYIKLQTSGGGGFPYVLDDGTGTNNQPINFNLVFSIKF